jgi:hypothetical protein
MKLESRFLYFVIQYKVTFENQVGQYYSCTNLRMESKQVKATAENVDEAVRELPDPNLVRYIYNLLFQCSLEAT